MSKQRMEQNWERMKTQILSVWGDLDESEMKKARGDLGQMVMATRESVNKVIARWTKAGILVMKGRTLRIVDRGALADEVEV